MGLTAIEAAKLTADNLQGPVIQPCIETIDNLIQKKAEQGWSKIDNLWERFKGKEDLSSNVKVAIRKHYEAKGFTWTVHPGPDPGHYASVPYTTLSWG